MRNFKNDLNENVFAPVCRIETCRFLFSVEPLRAYSIQYIQMHTYIHKADIDVRINGYDTVFSTTTYKSVIADVLINAAFCVAQIHFPPMSLER